MPLLILLILFFPARPTEVPPLLQQARQAIAAAQPFQAHFRQQALIDGRVELQEEGVILVADPRRLKMTYQEPEEKVLLVDGEQFVFYQPELQQAVRGKLGWALRETIWQVLFAEHSASNLSCRESKRLIEIRLDDPDQETIFEVQLGPGFLPVRVRQFDGSGLETVLVFNSYQRNIPLKEGDLSLVLPVGTEIIEQEEELN